MEGFEGRSPRVATAENNTQSATQPPSQSKNASFLTEIDGIRPQAGEFFADRRRNPFHAGGPQKRKTTDFESVVLSSIACLAELLFLRCRIAVKY